MRRRGGGGGGIAGRDRKGRERDEHDCLCATVSLLSSGVERCQATDNDTVMSDVYCGVSLLQGLCGEKHPGSLAGASLVMKERRLPSTSITLEIDIES